MKKLWSIVLATTLTLSLTACGGSASSSGSGQQGFKPSKTATVVAIKAAGTNVDIFARTTVDTVKELDSWKNTGSTLVVSNENDGGGAVGLRRVANLKGEEADNTIVTLATGDMQLLQTSTDMNAESFRYIGTLVSDKHIVYCLKDSAIQSFADLEAAVAGGNNIVVAGGGGDEVIMGNLFANALMEKNGSSGNVTYMQTEGNNETMEAVLGKHVDVGIGKQSVVNEYLKNGDVIVLGVEGNTIFDNELYKDSPTFEDLGYGDVGFIQSRAFVASPNMSDEAAAFWEKELLEAAESSYFAENYVEKFDSTLDYKNGADSLEYFKAAEENVKTILTQLGLLK